MLEFDAFMESYKAGFEIRPQYRKFSHEYMAARWQRDKCKKRLAKSSDKKTDRRSFKAAQKALLETPCHPVIDPSFKTLQYNRYADDFVIGIIGSKADAENVKRDIKAFLADTLKLTLSEEKTKVTHSGDLIRYLGYDFTVSRSKAVKRDKNGNLKRHWYGTVKLYVPHDKWFGKLQEYKALRIVTGKDGIERWKARHRGFLMNKPEVEIISRFNSEIRGIYNFYRLADNASVLGDFYEIMKVSLLRTLAAKFDSSVNKMKARYMRDGIIGVDYKTKVGTKRCEFYHDGFKKKDEALLGEVDVMPEYQRHNKPNSLATRLKAGVCESCGAERVEIHMHHVKRLKDLTGKTVFERLMIQKRRKSLALCPLCFQATRAKSSE